jgi:superfamily II DNA or RNA helicase
MAFRSFLIPNYDGNEVDVVALDPKQSGPNSPGLVHYAYAVAARESVLNRRAIEWYSIQNLSNPDYQGRHPEVIRRLEEEEAYRPGEMVLENGNADFGSQLNTTIRLGALELLANIHAGRLTATDKDPFPHQLALQQFMVRVGCGNEPRRILIADEVGLGKTIEVGLALRDILISKGSLDQFSCLYLTSGGLKEDAAEKLRSVMQGAIDDRNIVDTVDSFRNYGSVDISGINVGSMHAARLYITPAQKTHLHRGNAVAPDILIIDECHHAGSRESLEGETVASSAATQTYKAVLQLITGTYWENSRPPSLVIFMSATPFRSREQFLNLLRLLTHELEVEGQPFDAFREGSSGLRLTALVQNSDTPVHIIWRRQDDEEVHSWTGGRLFPHLDVLRPHRFDSGEDVQLGRPSREFLALVERCKETLSQIHLRHGLAFSGFARFQLEKKLTSSSVAAACWLFAWAVRHLRWRTQQVFLADTTEGTKRLRQLIGSISRSLASFNRSAGAPGHVDVEFSSEGYTFEAVRIAQSQNMPLIYDFNRQIRDRDDEDGFTLDSEDVVQLCELAEEILSPGGSGSDGHRTAENLKIDWLREMLERHPTAKFLVFTDHLQTCSVLQSAFGRMARQLTGNMDTAARRRAVADLGLGRGNARILVATSAADEGFDLQVADRVVHWDISASPAILMQRNGRVARLGQRFDVKAYYLILEGTHEERRDTRLQQTFAELGIDDEGLRNRILGSLEDDELERLEAAVQSSDGRVLGTILNNAADDNRRMEEQLGELSERIEARSVLNRMDLCRRLQTWQELGLPDTEVDYEISDIKWERPVFGEITTTEVAVAQKARFRRGRLRRDVVFDPEFIVFGDGSDEMGLAGLRPWTKKETSRGRQLIRPDDKVDILGDLICRIVRSPAADFARLDKAALDAAVPALSLADYLLVCSHPMLEEETEHADVERPYLNCYGFQRQDEWVCITPDGVSAAEMSMLIAELERQSRAELSEVESATRARYVEASKAICDWLTTTTHFGASSFLGPQKYFVPIPVALLAVEDGLLEPRQLPLGHRTGQ